MVTFNVDENPGELQPFLGNTHYAFPAIIARPYVESLVGLFSIPQNWLVDRRGVVREKSKGFDPKAAGWPQRMLEELTHMP